MGRERSGAILREESWASTKGEGGGLGLLSLEEGRLRYGGSAVRVLLLEGGCGVGALREGVLGRRIGRSELGREASGGGEARWTLWGLTWEG